MTDAEFRDAVVRALNDPVSDSEAQYYGCQCAEDYSRVYMARVWGLIDPDWDPEP